MTAAFDSDWLRCWNEPIFLWHLNGLFVCDDKVKYRHAQQNRHNHVFCSSFCNNLKCINGSVCVHVFVHGLPSRKEMKKKSYNKFPFLTVYWKESAKNCRRWIYIQRQHNRRTSCRMQYTRRTNAKKCQHKTK